MRLLQGITDEILPQKSPRDHSVSDLVLYHSADLKFFQRTDCMHLVEFGPRLAIPLHLFMNLRRRIRNHKVLSVLNLLSMDFQHVPHFLLHDSALRVQRAQINH
jgi:hypothetical protein